MNYPIKYNIYNNNNNNIYLISMIIIKNNKVIHQTIKYMSLILINLFFIIQIKIFIYVLLNELILFMIFNYIIKYK